MGAKIRIGIALAAFAAATLLAWLVKHAAVPAYALAAVTAGATSLKGFGKDGVKQGFKQLAADRRQRRTLMIGPGGKRVRVRDVSPTRLGLHQPADTNSGSNLQAYVHRDMHDRVAELIAAGGFVLIQGDSAAGKTRLAYEAAVSAVGDWHLVRPDGPEALTALAEVGLSRVVVWLEDLEAYLTPGGLTVKLLDKLAPPGGRVAIVATMRLAARDALGHGEDGPTDRRLAATALDVLAVGDSRGLPRLSRQLSAGERERAIVVGTGDQRIAEAVVHDNASGFAPWLAGGPAAVQRWTDGKNGGHKVGAALISAAVGFRRSGLPGPVPISTLAAVHRNYLPPLYADRSDVPSLKDELAWASSTERGTEPCLTQYRDDRAEAFDYLVDHVQRTSDEQDPVPEPVWDAVLALVTPDQADAVGIAAYNQSRADRAESAFRIGAIANQPTSLAGLGFVLDLRPGREAEAEAAYRQAIAAGNATALNGLGKLLSRLPGREAEAEFVLRQAVAAGDVLALSNLGILLGRLPGRKAEAEAVFQQALAASDNSSPLYLGILFSGLPGREADAEEAYLQAIDAGETDAWLNLGVLLSRQPGREAEAEAAYRQALAVDDAKALNNLGILFSGLPGREADAEEAYRKAIAVGNSKASSNLGNLLGRLPGRESDAEEAFQQAIAAGDTRALNSLGILLDRLPSRKADAEAVFRQAIAVGNADALNNLGIVLVRSPGREAEAEQLFRKAVDAGNTDAKNNLRILFFMKFLLGNRDERPLPPSAP